MIKIIAYHVTNGERSERFDYDNVVQDTSELNALKSFLSASHGGKRIDLIYQTITDAPKEPEPLIQVHIEKYPDVIVRNQTNITNFIKNY